MKLEDLEKFATMMLEYRQSLAFLVITPVWQAVLNLTGSSDDPTNLEAGMAFEKRSLVPNPGKAGEKVMYSFSMQLSFFFGNIDKAGECAEKLKQETKGLTKAMVFYPTRLFFFALIAIAKFRQRHISKLKRAKFRMEAEKYTKTLRSFVSAGGINIVHKVQLLEAELLSLSPKEDVQTVQKMYDSAIVSSSRGGFLNDAALANYLCFQFCDDHGEEAATDYLVRSYNLWIDWDARAVADSLWARHPDCFGSSSSASLNFSSSGYRSRTRFNASLSELHKHLSV